ncbi:MAG: Mrp/NBP35 family ATP-binding protein [Oscillospiraceae bacterium]|jgi:Mrp family chromosome partitioning ATPase|nr:Mrp/NBP35 family ATP-binding protein [Oscillospiraceae bacterium]
MEDECSCGKTSCDESCGENCARKDDKKETPNNSFVAELNASSSVKHVIGIVSGKGGVGKSLVSSLLSVLFNRKGYRTAILDADITGPSIPRMFGIKGKAVGNDLELFPKQTNGGIHVMSVNLLLDTEETPVVWRGPLIANIVKQFWTDVVWGNIDFMFVDMPPGTGDVPLTVFQSLPVDGIIIVTSPQDLVSMIVKKAYNMARMMNIPVLGIVENMSYYQCPDCGRKEEIFGKSKLPETAAQLGLDVLGRIPIDPALARLCDEGKIEDENKEYLSQAVETIERKLHAGEEIKK